MAPCYSAGMDKRIGPLPPRAALLLLYMVRCEDQGIKPNLDRRGRALNTLRLSGCLRRGENVTSARGRRLVPQLGASPLIGEKRTP